MKANFSRFTGCVVTAALVMITAGCQQEGVFVLVPPLASLRQVPTPAVVRPADLARQDFMLDAESNRYKHFNQPSKTSWLNADRFSNLCQEYFTETGLFQAVLTESPSDRSEMHLVFRPHVTVKQYVRPSVSGTVLTLGTGLIYKILGGSDIYRYVDCELAVEVQSPSGRHIATYVSSCRSAERLVTDQPKQLGPLVSYAFTKSLEDVAGQISVDNDLLMRALSTDMTAKGVIIVIPDSPMRIQVHNPKGIVVKTKTAQVSGQVTGIDRPVELHWSLNGSSGGKVPLKDTSAGSVKQFAFQVPLSEGIAKIALTLRGKATGARVASELARTEIAYLCLPGDMPLPAVRQRWAVVIGVSKYAHAGKRFQNLKYADRDAKAIYDFLISPRSGGFSRDHVLCLINKDATATNIRHAMFEFLAKADKDDLVVIFFSGHGMPQPGTENFFMLCHDTNPDRLASTSFPMWDIDMALRRFIKAQRVVVLADACHAGGISNPVGAKGKSYNPVHQYLQQLALAQPGRLIFTASEARELSHESDKYGGGHGVFTYFLLKGLNGAADEDHNGLVTTGEIIEYVRSKVLEATKGKQHPDPAGQYDRKLPLAVVEQQ